MTEPGTGLTAPPGMVAERLVADEAIGEKLEQVWADSPGLKGWFTTVDHKRVGKRYLVTAGLFFCLSGIMAATMRTQLIQPEKNLVTPYVYNELFTLHGTTMIFWFATPMLFGFGNYFLPMMIGTRDMAFPRLNMFSWWVFLLSGLLVFASLPFGLAPLGGWFGYVPLNETSVPQTNVAFYTLGLLFLGVSTTAGAINFLVTVIKLRAPRMTLNKVPLFVWAIVVTSFMVVFALPPLNLANAMLFMDRRFGTKFFVPADGGSVVMWQHLFWLFGHPDVYIIVLPALGIVSSIVPVFARRSIAAYPLVVLATVATGIIGFGVWVHHMFAIGLPGLSLAYFSAASMVVTIPSGIQMFAWLATMLHGKVVVSVPMLYAAGFVAAFVMGGVTGVMFGLVPFDQQVTDSYFVVAHFHYVLVGGAVLPIFAGLFFWWPKISGRMIPKRHGVVSFVLVFTGLNVTFFPQHIAGLLGMPRRVFTYPADTGWTPWMLASTIGAYILGIGVLWTLGVFARSILHGEKAPDNPWGANTLEWATASPPKHYNFPVFPSVRSRDPLWDDRTLPSFVANRNNEERTLSSSHLTLRTSELDGRPEGPMVMPAESPAPFILAFFILVAVATLLFHLYAASAAAGVVILLTIVPWLWRQASIEEEKEEESS